MLAELHFFSGKGLMMKFDVLIVGGGPAGLSAALILGRCHRQTLLCDEGHQRNLSSHAIHGLLGREGRSPSAFLEEGRQELLRYTSVSLRGTRVTDIMPFGNEFEFTCADGTTGSASKVLLATGLVDELPELPGIEPLYGVSVHHCLYCDGFEYTGKAVAAYGKADQGAELAVMMQHWMPDVVACSDGTAVSPQAIRKLEERNIPLRGEPIKSLEGIDGQLTNIVFESGEELPRAGLFFSTGCHQASTLSERLGCKRGEKGGVAIDPSTEETSVPGVYVAGDVSRDVLLVAVAAAEGALAAVAINKALLRRDGFCD
jgi:thioredoxin reductase